MSNQTNRERRDRDREKIKIINIRNIRGDIYIP